MSAHPTTSTSTNTNPLLVVLAWLMVGLPLAYGLWMTLVRASALFNG